MKIFSRGFRSKKSKCIIWLYTDEDKHIGTIEVYKDSNKHTIGVITYEDVDVHTAVITNEQKAERNKFLGEFSHKK